MEKNQKIKLSLMKTRELRKTQTCKVYKVKVQHNSLTPIQKEQLKMLFIEAKWFVNDILNFSQNNNIREYKPSKQVEIKLQNGTFLQKPLEYISEAEKQALQTELISNIKTLSTLKKNGYKIGALKFKSEVRSIPLKQAGATHKILSNKRVKIQGVKGKLIVNGLKQIPEKCDLANAKLLNTPLGYYIAFTVYINKEEEKTFKQKEDLGIDFGCSTTLTCSDGQMFNVKIQESERLKKLQRKLSKQNKCSKGFYKTKIKIKQQYQKMKNKKIDKANKICSYLLNNFNIFMQDENLSGWKIHYGKSVQHSILGLLKSRLKPRATYVLNKFEPTTKLCYNCGQIKEKLPVSNRIYTCDCGIAPEDRDIHAAKNMIFLSKIRSGTGQIYASGQTNLFS